MEGGELEKLKESMMRACEVCGDVAKRVAKRGPVKKTDREWLKK